MRRFLLVAATLFFVSPVAANDDPQLSYGGDVVTENCSRCPAVTMTDRSLHPDAPAFRSLSRRYPIEALAEALAEGISTGHPDMPEFVATPEQIGAIIAYIKSLGQQ